MTLSVKNKELAKDILDIIGGNENVVKASHCATRLRIVLKRSIPNAKKQVSNLDGVVTVVENNGQFQVVIGNAVGSVFQEFEKLIDQNDNSNYDSQGQKESIVNRVIATMSAVFAPFIYVLAAAGILQGLLIIINLIIPSFKETGTFEVFNFISWAPFTFLPIFIALTASKHFNVNTYIAVACCAALVSPDLAGIIERIGKGESFHFLGLPLSETSYVSSVLPPLLLVWALSYVEKYLNKYIPEVVRQLFVPFFSIVIMVPLTLIIIGPLASGAAHGIASGFNTLVDVAPWLAGILIGTFWQVFVIFGVHWGVTPMVLANFEEYKSDAFQAFQTIAVIAQFGAVLGVFFKSKNAEIKKVSLSAGITGIFGITEPAMYGINLRFKKPFIIACISGGIGALVASFFNPKYYAYAGLPGPITIVNGYSGDNPTSIWGIVIGSIIAIVLPIILIQIFGYGEDTTDKVQDADINNNSTEINNDSLEEYILSPTTGSIVPLKDVKDPIFSEGMMGKGIAIQPIENEIKSPVVGKVSMIAASKHAIGITSNNGIEILIHVGLDTVNLKGNGFEVLTKENDNVEIGQTLLRFNQSYIEKQGYNTITPIIITNSDEFEEIIIEDKNEVTDKDNIMTIIKK
ncbi:MULTISPECIES: beta-glucoside-specific PTS transporter subunit IIABC [Staphylococcus]|uniref:beta-glucoside-specific PTS transporter subunit IIABC n=1 Tax=Staphylococcus TaxID=1279 RepID=UPI001F00B956|nr:beta-glucoside-specific PTS transporter subunit IIABC [Staphylococcus warneri]MCF7594009.1 beta-glucoside-specific PTS transporter subunit IIABC [Staphylococcus warneri]MCI2769365.1 beta-glucoside-specific PTS transporter subunit IIABC [Staphylococcus warneri]MDK7946823.1 beta-glucoside-specific PTS transporter subunit IIABC [Staphylococcus warneri]MDK8348091.1 beta-glucoside-specific PTS transporter subunit IIABC [Staphylococcus warneri]MDK8371177.1 beta-glucoside-specific PTS transporter 